MNCREEGFLLLEVIILLAIGGMLLTSLLGVGRIFMLSWIESRNQTRLHQEARTGVENIILQLERAGEIIEVKEKKITFKTSSGVEREIFYKEDIGLCLDSKQNKISNQIAEVKFSRRSDDLLQIELAAKEEKKSENTYRLKTAVKIGEKQFVR